MTGDAQRGVVDAHAHCGPDKYLDIATLRWAMAAADVDRAVLVQHIDGDNDYLDGIVAQLGDSFAAVMWVPPGSGQAATEIERRCRSGRFQGIRLFVETLADDRGTWELAAGLGLTVVVSFLDLGLDDVVGDLLPLVRRHPDTRFVLTRFGLRAGATPDQLPLTSLQELADQANAVVELSPLHSRTDGAPSPGVATAVRSTLDLFGVDRAIFGAGFPSRDRHGILADPIARYRADFQALRDGDLGVEAAELEDVLVTTPGRLWFGERPTPR